jgi:rfaE bifunctional protein kinase chain/domain
LFTHHDLSKERLRGILGRICGLQIGVIGDLGLDAFWYADMTRSFMSRETPRFARPVVREIYSPGAGANVAQNLKALGVGQVVVFSVLGDDWRGAILRQEMSRRGIAVEHLIVSEKRNTTAFIRPILMGYKAQQEDARLDFENAEPLPRVLEEALMDVLTRCLPSLDGLLIADQLDVNGIITGRVRERLNSLAADEPQKVFVADSRQNIELFRNMVLKPNWVEATQAVHRGHDPRCASREELFRSGEALSQQTSRAVFITLGEEGVLVCDRQDHHHIPAAPVHPPLDPVGAGDTFSATLGVALAAGATNLEAGMLANLAAAVTVEKLDQTGTASPQEILERHDLALMGAGESTPHDDTR